MRNDKMRRVVFRSPWGPESGVIMSGPHPVPPPNERKHVRTKFYKIALGGAVIEIETRYVRELGERVPRSWYGEIQ